METERRTTVNQVSRCMATTSEKYNFYSTQELISALASKNWMPSKIQEARCLKPEKQGFQKHMIRFENPGLQNPDFRPEIVFYNSHDGSSALQFHAGLFRFVCLNGMVVGDNLIPKMRVIHKGYGLQDDIFKAVDSLTDQLLILPAVIADWQAIELTPDEQGIYTASAFKLRYDETEAKPEGRDLTYLNGAYRAADKLPTLYHTFNRVQENMMKGRFTVHRYNKDKADFDRWSSKARKITSVQENIKLNKALWELTSKMAELKGATTA